MILFAVLAGMALIVVLSVLVPLLRPRAPPQPRAEHDIEIYRDQLAEVERDRARGLVAEDQFEASRAEIGRRLLAADSARGEPSGGGDAPHTRAILAVVLAAVLPLAAGGLYFWQGAPLFSGQPVSSAAVLPAPQSPLPDSPPAERDADMATLVERLAERMKERPGDARGWRLLGRSLASLGRYSEAARAYGRAAALLPADADLRSLHGEALASAGGGTIAGEAERAFAAALQIDPGEPRARFYLGLAALQKGDPKAALMRWRALEAASPDDAEWLPMLRRRIASLAPPPQAPRGPTREDIAAAQQMAPEERAEMIRGMVAQLALRLREEPDDAEGWARLARSYRVLGEAEKERDALAELARLRPDDVGALSSYARSMLRTAKGAPPPAFVETIDRILALDPDNRAALLAAGAAAYREGDRAVALRHWSRLRRLLPEGSPERAEIDLRIDALGEGS